MSDIISELENAFIIVRNQIDGKKALIRQHQDSVELLNEETKQLVVAENALATILELEKKKLSIESGLLSEDSKNLITPVAEVKPRTSELPSISSLDGVKWDKERFNTKNIKDFDKEKFLSSLPIEIGSDEFKNFSIPDATIAILRKFKQPLHKKELAACILQGGKAHASNNFPETVKSSLKDHTSSDYILVKKGFYFLREWDPLKWGLNENGDILVDAENNVEAEE